MRLPSNIHKLCLSVMLLVAAFSCRKTETNTHSDMISYEAGEEENAEFSFSLVDISPEVAPDAPLEVAANEAAAPSADQAPAGGGESRLSLVAMDVHDYVQFDMSEYGKTWDAKYPVQYVGEAELKNYEVDFRPDGQVQIGGKAIAPGKYIFVMGGNGKVYVGNQSIQRFHHSSFLSGKPISSAGHMYLDDQGRLSAITNETGHYQIPGDANRQFLNELARRKVSISNLQVGKFVGGPQGVLYEKRHVRLGVYTPPLDIDSLNEARLVRQEFKDGTVIEKTPDGVKTSQYPDGTKRKNYPNGYIETFHANGMQVKEWPDRGVRQFIYPSGTIHNVYANGVEELRWDNGAIETRYPNGGGRIVDFPSGEKQTIFSDGTTQHQLGNKTVITQYTDGSKRTAWPGGEVEFIDRNGFVVKKIQNNMELRRYPNGVSEIKFADGTSEVTLRDGTRIHRASGAGYETKTMEPSYRELDEGRTATTNYKRTVTYLSEVERLRYEAFITDDGRFVNFEGKPLSSSAAEGIFVMDKSGRIFVGEHKTLQFHHSSFLAGADVAASGYMHLEGGKIIAMDNNSGHYRDINSNAKFTNELSARGFKTADIRIGTVTDYNARPRAITFETRKVGGGISFDGKVDANWKPISKPPATLGDLLKGHKIQSVEPFDARVPDPPRRLGDLNVRVKF